MERFFRKYGSRLQPLYERMPVPLQNVFTTARGWVLSRNRYHPKMYAYREELHSHDSWSAAQVRAYQLLALRDAVEKARRAPLYATYPAFRWDSLDCIRKLPILGREQIREDSSTLVSSTTPEKHIVRVRTTGTTGASLEVGYTREEMRALWALRIRQRDWIGIAPRDWRITLFGSRVISPHRHEPPFWTYNLTEHQILVSIFHFSVKTADAYIRFFNHQKGLVLEGFPSVLGIVADLLLERGTTVPMRAVFTDGEPLYPFLREKIEKAFETKVYDTYGNTEMCGLIQQCERDRMHLIPECAYLEILNDKNEPAAPGEEGDFVWTTLMPRVMPLVRYRIGDRGSWEEGPCECGRAFPLVRPGITRESDLLRCPDGRIFSPRALNQLLKRAVSLRFCQFVQSAPDRVVVRGVASDRTRASAELADVSNALQLLLGRGIGVSSELADQPIMRAGGKMPLIVRYQGAIETSDRAAA